MIYLGDIAISKPAAVREARKKVRRVTEILTGDPLVAVRIGTAISEIARQLLGAAEGGSIGVSVETAGSSDVLVLTFKGLRQSEAVERVAGFFDAVEDRPASREGSQTEAWLHLPAGVILDRQRIARLTDIVRHKGRDELMGEVQAKNIELQESLDNLRKTRSAKERMESELNIGREIQMSMLPLTFPAFPERHDFDVHAALHPAREVGGDFYDMFLIDRDHFCFCVGDVSGKGVPAALFMAVCKTLIKSRAANDLSPASILSHVNSELSHNNDSCMFVTVFLGILDVRTGDVTYSNAGHNPPYVRRTSGELVRLDRRHGPIIGAAEGIAYRQDTVSLGLDDIVFLYTDGVTEAMDPGDQLYSEDRLKKLLPALPCESVEKFVRAGVDDVWLFQGEAEQADDVTVLAVVYFGPEEKEDVHELVVVVINQLEEIERLNRMFNEFAERYDIQEALRRKLNLVFDELLNNIISYGYDDDLEHKIEMSVSLSDNGLIVTFVDDGKPFNPFEVEKPDTALSVEDRPIGGLGVHLVQSLMDSASYERRGERNVVTLRKSLETPNS